MDGDVGQRKNSFKYDLVGTLNPSPEQFKFVQNVNRSPMWIRRSHFLEKLHHIDQRFAPSMWDDAEICLRACTVGLKVGWYPAGFQIGRLGRGGMVLWNQPLHNRQDEENAKRIYEMYGEKFKVIDTVIDEANKKPTTK